METTPGLILADCLVDIRSGEGAWVLRPTFAFAGKTRRNESSFWSLFKQKHSTGVPTATVLVAQQSADVDVKCISCRTVPGRDQNVRCATYRGTWRAAVPPGPSAIRAFPKFL